MILVTFVVLMGAGVTQIRQGYWSGFTYGALIITVVFCSLVLNRRATITVVLILAFQYSVITLWQEQAELPYSNPLPVTAALGTTFKSIVTGTGVLISILGMGIFLINEFAMRAKQVQELVDTLEERVQLRTAELQEAYEQVQTLNFMKDAFVANVSHELRTPLTSIKLYQQLLEKKSTEDQLEYLMTLGREVQRLENLIEALLLLSKLDQERVYFNVERIDLSLIIEEYVRDRMLLAKRNNLLLIAETGNEPVEALADKDMLGQVLSILLTNALLYTPPGGSVMVRANTHHDNQQQWVGFSVIDTGPGITPEEQSQLFKRFFRGQSAQKRGVSGTGLGLAIAKEIVDHHLGWIEVKSTGIPGKETIFSVWLPTISETT